MRDLFKYRNVECFPNQPSTSGIDHLIKDILRVLNEDSSDDDESVNNSEEEISHSNNIVYEVLPSNGLRRSNQK